MTYPLAGLPGPEPGPPGCSYAAVLVRAATADVLPVLREVRFTGWLAPPEDGWVVAPAASVGTVASGRRGVVEVGAALADRLPAVVLAVRVVDDRQLALVGRADGGEICRYVSDPSWGAGDDVLPDPLGAAAAGPLAVACDRPAAAGELAEVLAEQLDPDSVNESERLARILRLLGLPPWVVAVDSLPRDIPTGPRAADLTRLRAGRPGLPGRLLAAGSPLRRRRPPPPVIPDPPRAAPDPWFR